MNTGRPQHYLKHLSLIMICALWVTPRITQAQSPVSGDSIKTSGIGGTTNRPTDDAPHSAHPTEPVTDTAGESARDETLHRDKAQSGLDQRSKAFKRAVEDKLSVVSDRLLALENRGGLINQNLKADFQKDVTQVRGEEKTVALKIRSVDELASARFEKAKSEITKKVSDLEGDLARAEKKYAK